MTHIKSILLFGMLVFFFQPSLFAQLPASRYEGKTTLKTSLQTLRQQFNGFSVMGRWHQVNFLNPTFEANLGSAYERSTGWYLGGRITYYPFFFDVAWNSSFFTVRNLPTVAANETIGQKGWDFFVSTALLPYGKLAKFLNPYAGIGYQKSQLCLHCTKSEDDPDNLDVPFNAVSTSSPFWKTGLSVSYKTVRLEAEFKQTLSLKNTYALNAWSVGLGWKPSFKSLK